MDSSIRLPRGFRIGVDGLVGLVPVVGAIPLLGDVFDVAFKANLRNARLMDAYLDRSAPRLLFRRGQFLREARARERLTLTESEVLVAMRGQGIAEPMHVEAVVLETDGSFSIVRDQGRRPHSTLVGVSGTDWPR